VPTPTARSAGPAVWATDPADEPRARQLAETLGLPLAISPDTSAGLLLVVRPDRLELRPGPGDASGPVWVDFTAPELIRRRRTGGARSDDLARAVGLGPPRPFVLDATAGLGRDSWLLAGLGCRILAVERSPVVWALLDDGLRRARQAPEADLDVLDRISLERGDARDVLLGLAEDQRPDVVLIDPMYPPSQRTALPRKEMRLLSSLLGQDDDAARLLEVARRTARRRVVVKRHLRDAPLADERPTHARSGRSTRFDVYVRVDEAAS
jgi:16S rRNA (guanine1516-N2)-methyltransferase